MQITNHAVVMERRKFFRMLDQYRSDLRIYIAQKPMEDLRIKLLRDIGAAVCTLLLDRVLWGCWGKVGQERDRLKRKLQRSFTFAATNPQGRGA